MNQASSASAERFIRDNVLSMKAYTPGEQINHATKLNTNECPWPPSPKVFEALQQLGEQALRQYPDPSSKHLRQLAAEKFSCDLDEILVGNGSDDCLTIIYRSICAPGDHVVCPWPSYGLYDTLAAIQDVSIKHIPYEINSQGDGNWSGSFDLSNSHAKLALIANPNNPSGTYFRPSEICRMAQSFSGVLVVDEAYIDFVDGDEEQVSLIPFIKQLDNLIVIRTFSKSYSLAGARVGLLFANATLIHQFNKVKDSYNVNVMSQVAAEAALKDEAYHKQLVNKIRNSRRDLETACKSWGWSWPKSEANFILCYVGEMAHELYQFLKQKGILVRWWDTDELRHCLRITAGTPEENQRFIAAVEEYRA